MHELIVTWFSWVRSWGYLGVFVLSAMGSTVLPVPSELVLPPAAYWAAQGQMTLSGVILSATVGSYVGAVAMYLLFYWSGSRFFQILQKFKLVRADKINSINGWVQRFGAPGIVLARLLPVFRHLVSIPAGVFRLRFRDFSLATILGSALWSILISVWGQKILGSHPELLNSPEEMMAAVKKEMAGFVVLILVVGGLYLFVSWYRLRSGSAAKAAAKT